MTTTVGRSLRGARAAVFAAMCVGLTAVGHVWMSGRAVPLWALALAFAALIAAGYALAGRQRGFLPISALMLAGELALHELFCLAQGAGKAASAAVSASASATASIPPLPKFLSGPVVPLSDWICGMGAWKSGSGMAAMPGMPAGVTGSSGASGSLGARLAADVMMTGHGDVGMIVVHAIAGLICAWWLWRGEAAVFQLLRLLAVLTAPALLLLWPATLVVTPDFPRFAAAPGHDDRILGRYKRLFSTVLARRGPPPCSCFCAF
jgi:hypothetical protein